MNYDLPDVIRVEADGPVRIVRLSRPEQLNAINEELHLGLTRLFPQFSADRDARVAVITGEGRAFSAGGDFDLLDRMANDRALRRDVIAEGRELVLNMIRCRVPVVAAVNGPAVGLGCSVIALSDVVYMAESAYLVRPARHGRPRRRRRRSADVAAAHEPVAREGVRVHRRPHQRAARGRDRSRQPRVPRRRGARRRARRRAQDRRAPAAGGRGDEAGAEPARRAGRARHDRLRDGGRERVVRHARAARRTSTASWVARRRDRSPEQVRGQLGHPAELPDKRSKHATMETVVGWAGWPTTTPPERENDPADRKLDADIEAIVDDASDPDPDSVRHYLQDPNHLAGNARDEDEQEQDDELDVDQTELEELGLTLDDPHQPESE